MGFWVPDLKLGPHLVGAPLSGLSFVACGLGLGSEREREKASEREREDALVSRFHIEFKCRGNGIGFLWFHVRLRF